MDCRSIRSLFSVKIGKAIMMLSSENEVLRPSISEEINPALWVVQ